MQAQRWRAWLARIRAPHPSRTPEQVRQDRADAIDALRLEVRQLQQGIKDGSDALANTLTGEERLRQERRLASLERDLEQTQRALARFQARI